MSFHSETTYRCIESNGAHFEGGSWEEAKVIVEKEETAKLMDQLHRDMRGMEYAVMDRDERRSSMRIIALDLGTSTGWAITAPELGTESGTQRFDLQRGESPGMRFIRFRKWLSDLAVYVKPDLIAFELPHHRGGYATEFLHGLTTRIQELCADRGIQHAGVHTATLKKHATGSGRAEKGGMRAAAERLFPGQKIETLDQADALCVLYWAIETLNPSEKETARAYHDKPLDF